MKIKGTSADQLIVDESTQQQIILVDGLLLFGENPAIIEKCQDILIFFTLDDQINLQKFQKCEEKFELILKKEASFKGKPSKLLLDTRNLVLVTDTSLYIFNYGLKRISVGERAM